MLTIFEIIPKGIIDMKLFKHIALLIAITAIVNSFLYAAPGDTTWIQANSAQLSWYGSYDTGVTFPSGSTTYRKILMVFTLGKYSCPSGSTYCGDWDYTVQNYVFTASGDTFELGRLITPYANAGAPRTPWTWQQHYVFDVTDFASKLRGSARMRIFYSGYSGGFTGDIKFAFIEGTPEREVKDIRHLWYGSFAYGDTTRGGINAIDTHFPALNQTAPGGTEKAVMKFIVTGHGSDGSYCSEFCSHDYRVLVNGSSVGSRTIWRSDCGSNQLYPQSGTWMYERGNWCPGSMVLPQYTTLSGVSSGTSYNTGISFDSYIGNGSASYTTDATVIYYGKVNKSLDASVEEIISPTDNENHFRENPNCGLPVIRVRNSGTTAITSMSIMYGVAGSGMLTYNWSGSLPSLTDTVITLPALPDLRYQAGTTGRYTFQAAVTSVNGTTDADQTDDTLRSTFIMAPKWPTSFKLVFRTNNEPISTGSTVSETSWKIYDLNNTVVAQRSGAALSTLYTDTVTLDPGCYKLEITDGSCDGLNWWGFSSAGISSGYFFARKLNNTNINMNGYTYAGTYAHDFGCGFTQYFTTDWPAGIDDINQVTAGLTVFPNPASDKIHVQLQGIEQPEGWITLTDVTGRVVVRTYCTETDMLIPTDALASGIYSVMYIPASGAAGRVVANVSVLK